ncbi:MAG: hypothetical protein QOI95_722 [Acidimicrobiaceae bacterium]
MASSNVDPRSGVQRFGSLIRQRIIGIRHSRREASPCPSSTSAWDGSDTELAGGTLSDGTRWSYRIKGAPSDRAVGLLLGGTSAYFRHYATDDWADLINRGSFQWTLIGAVTEQWFIIGKIPCETTSVKITDSDGLTVTSSPLGSALELGPRWFAAELSGVPRAVIAGDGQDGPLLEGDLVKTQAGLDEEASLAPPDPSRNRVAIVHVQTVGSFGLPLGGTPAPQPPALSDPEIAKGRDLYLSQGCASCHGSDGAGGVGPPIGHGASITVFPNGADELQFLTLGSAKWPSQTYGANNAPLKGGQPGYGGLVSEDDLGPDPLRAGSAGPVDIFD